MGGWPVSKKRRLGKGTAKDWPSLPLLEFTVALARAMKANNMKQADLARVLDVSPAYISSVMAGNENHLGVEQMARIADAANGELHITIAKKGLRVKWVEDTLDVPSLQREINAELAAQTFASRHSYEGYSFVAQGLRRSGLHHVVILSSSQDAALFTTAEDTETVVALAGRDTATPNHQYGPN